MHQTHAVRHRQYTFEEKSRRSFCPDGVGVGGGINKQKKQYVELKEQKMNRVHVKTKRRR